MSDNTIDQKAYYDVRCMRCYEHPWLEANGDTGSARLRCACDDLAVETSGFSIEDIPPEWTYRSEGATDD